jgi:competence protein ComEC
MPGGGNMMIDAGPSGRRGGNTRRIISFLHSQGVEKIDCLVISHPDSDHYGGTPYLMEEFEVGMLLHNGSVGRSKTYKEIIEEADARGIEVNSVAGGDKITGFGNIDIVVLSPLNNVTGSPHDDNNRSVVLLITHGKNRFLFTGDILQDGQQLMNRAGFTPDCDILKIPHHGDNGAAYEPFLIRARPALGIISAGINNPYGHPDPYTLRMYERMGIPVMRTDKSGAIKIVSDGKRLYARPFIQEPLY